MDTQQQHFNKIFWFLAGTTGFTLLYAAAITFIPIPKENIRFADTALSFLMGCVVGGSFSFLVGGTSMSYRKENAPTTTKAEVTATITQTPEDGTQKP